MGTAVGTEVADGVGATIGKGVGEKVGKGVGEEVGKGAGEEVGKGIGEEVGKGIGEDVGKGIGEEVGKGIGEEVDDATGEGGVGERVGLAVSFLILASPLVERVAITSIVRMRATSGVISEETSTKDAGYLASFQMRL